MADIVAAPASLLTLDEAKAYLRITDSGDDILLPVFLDAAITGVLQYCRLQAVPDGLEPVFKVAALLTLGDLYAASQEDARLRSETTEGVGSRSYTDLPTMSANTQTTIDRLLKPHRMRSV